jgi:hypothetical protein
MFFSEKTFWLCRRVISARRGCFQLPGLSVAAGAVVCLMGVDLTGVKVEDDMALVVMLPIVCRRIGKIATLSTSTEYRGGNAGDEQPYLSSYAGIVEDARGRDWL